MPTNRKRTRRTAKGIRVTPAAVEAFRDHDHLRLARELGLEPWDCNPLESEADPLIAWPMDFDLEASREQARRLREELLRHCSSDY